MVGGVTQDDHTVAEDNFQPAQWESLKKLCDELHETYPKAEAIYDFLHWFDGKIISGEIGQIKPDPEIFYTLTKTYNLEFSPSSSRLLIIQV